MERSYLMMKINSGYNQHLVNVNADGQFVKQVGQKAIYLPRDNKTVIVHDIVLKNPQTSKWEVYDKAKHQEYKALNVTKVVPIFAGSAQEFCDVNNGVKANFDRPDYTCKRND